MFRPVDPWRTLQVPHDASLDEIKAAYRKLAKLYHPDSAGEKAVPRFLAIQAAYEELTTGPGRLRLGMGSRSPRQPAARPRRPSSASAQPRPTSGPAAEPRDHSRARPGGATQGGATQGGATQGGATQGGATQGGATQGGSTAPGARSTSSTGGRTRGRRRAKAGSTSYDDAAFEPFEPSWEGASWYGESSGTYWTLNPREFADPRKHGPDYQARARAAAAARARQDGTAGPAATTAPDERNPMAEAAGTDADSDAAFTSSATSGDAEPTADFAFATAGSSWPSGTQTFAAPTASGRPNGRAEVDAWSSPSGLIMAGLLALLIASVAMLALDSPATAGARPAIFWVAAAAVVVGLLVRLLAGTRRHRA